MTRAIVLATLLVLVVGLWPLSLAGSAADDELDKLEASDVEIRLHFPEARLGTILDALGTVGGFEVALHGEEPETEVSIDWSDITVRDALWQLGVDHGLTFRVPSPTTLVVVYPPTDE